MDNYNKEKKNNHILLKVLGKLFLIFIIATISIVLYDMYINIEVEEETYTADKVSKETIIRKRRKYK